MTVRVTRILEYEYETAEGALADMERWHVPANGAQRYGHQRTVRSAIVGPVPVPTTGELALVPVPVPVDSGSHHMVG